MALVQKQVLKPQGSLRGQRTCSRLSGLTVSAARLYSPPGEILVGGSAGFGRTQTVPSSRPSPGKDLLPSDGVRVQVQQ